MAMLWRIRFVWYSGPLVLTFVAGVALGEGEPIRASLAVDWDAPGVHVEGAPLFGSHIATWDPPERWTPELIARLKAAGISALMFPGEATSANYFWNGY